MESSARAVREARIPASRLALGSAFTPSGLTLVRITKIFREYDHFEFFLHKKMKPGKLLGRDPWLGHTKDLQHSY